MGKYKELAFLCYESNIQLCVTINSKIQPKWLKIIAYIVCSPWLLIRWLFHSVWEKAVAQHRMQKRLLMEQKMHFEYELAVVAIAKNEAPYLREWLAYYKIIGVDRVYLYDNESTDDTKEVIADFIQDGFVIYTYFPGKNRQMDAYNDAIEKYKNKTRYMAFIDCDEFIVPTIEQPLSQLVHALISKVPNAAGLSVNWSLYGSSGCEKRQPGLLTETYLQRGDDFAWQNFHVKTIVNPRVVKDYISPHFPVYMSGAWSVDSKGNRQRLWYNHDVDFSVVRCNHYFCKSREEFITKRNRGMADRQEQYDFSKFDEYDLNDIYDDIMLRYSGRIKEIALSS